MRLDGCIGLRFPFSSGRARPLTFSFASGAHLLSFPRLFATPSKKQNPSSRSTQKPNSHLLNTPISHAFSASSTVRRIHSDTLRERRVGYTSPLPASHIDGLLVAERGSRVKAPVILSCGAISMRQSDSGASHSTRSVGCTRRSDSEQRMAVSESFTRTTADSAAGLAPQRDSPPCYCN